MSDGKDKIIEELEAEIASLKCALAGRKKIAAHCIELDRLRATFNDKTAQLAEIVCPMTKKVISKAKMVFLKHPLMFVTASFVAGVAASVIFKSEKENN